MRRGRALPFVGACLAFAAAHAFTAEHGWGVREAKGCSGGAAIQTCVATSFTASFVHPVDGIPPWGALGVEIVAQYSCSPSGGSGATADVSLAVRDAKGALVPAPPVSVSFAPLSSTAPPTTVSKVTAWSATGELPPDAGYTLELSSGVGDVKLPFAVAGDLPVPAPKLTAVALVTYANENPPMTCQVSEPAPCNGTKVVTESFFPKKIARAGLDLTEDAGVPATPAHYFATKTVVSFDGGAEQAWNETVPVGAKAACARLVLTHPKTGEAHASEPSCVDLGGLDLSPQLDCAKGQAFLTACTAPSVLGKDAKARFAEVCGGAGKGGGGGVAGTGGASGGAGATGQGPTAAPAEDDGGCTLGAPQRSTLGAVAVALAALALARRRPHRG